jgi:DNA-directed RNA polymerase specialized sigma24 family protein
MRVYFPISQINNDVLRRLIEKNKKKPPQELHLMVYQMCYVRACRYKSLSAEDVACEVYIKIMKSIMNIDKENPKSYILTAIDRYCNDKEKQRKYRQSVNNKITNDVHKFFMYQIQYGVFEEVNNDNED